MSSSILLVRTALLLGIIFSSTIPALGSSDSPAFFVFGDSTVDPGNNNYIGTTPEFRADFEPYGRNGFFDKPTGRFSDGRVIVDFIAEYAGLPIIPAYKQPGADFSHGANFASGGAGVLPETNRGMVIDLPTQLKDFEEVEKWLIEKVGTDKAKEVLREAVYFISIGSNDYLGGYRGNPEMRQRYRPEAFIGTVVGNLTSTIQDLYEKGARKFGFLSIGPLGCLPALRAQNAATSGNNNGACLEEASSLAQAHNNALKSLLFSLSAIFRDIKYCNSDFYDWIEDKLNNPAKHGFKDGERACCGAGPFGGLYTCGGQREAKEYSLCKDADMEGYIWFDSFHPTERIHEEYARMFWDGPSSLVGPYTLRQLFTGKRIIADYVDDPKEEDPFASLS
ncbi:hypothetical protein MLD38_014230 [Melastoma candidum]|uniref:Uncharacterized protein n=1 Tax=Melastoma candidum TaxID=119954 RepID=A0ACB9RGA4_9MYRT|nr:hypothetical protein MLD38_014230 [Melastoma candidum]